MKYKVHETATVDEGADIGIDTSIWHYSHVRANSKVGDNCVLAHCVYVDENVVIGDRVKIQNKASIYNGVTIGDDVFIGPHVCFTNDLNPRAFRRDWKITPTNIEKGVSIGANSTIKCGINIGRFAMIGAGSVVTKDVPEFALVVGSPGRIVGQVCYCGEVINREYSSEKVQINECPHDSDLDVQIYSGS